MSTDKERAKTIELAEKYVKKGKLQDAINEYKKLLSGSAQDINFRNIISDLYVKLNQKDKAVEELYKIGNFYDERGLFSQTIVIYKKINRLMPNDIESTKKLADLYFNQGFLSEAKAEYLKVAKDLKDENRNKEAIQLCEKILKLDKRDNQIKLSLADLYTKEKQIDHAVDMLNDVAEANIHSNALEEAHEILIQAKTLRGDNLRTLANLIDLLKKEGKKKDAFQLLYDVLQKKGDNIKALRLLGNLYFEDKDLNNAREIFSKIVSLRPKDVEAVVKLGQVEIFQDNLDHAFEMYDPLIEILIKKQKTDKAIGLLGLILSSKKVHIPTLKKLANIYKSRNQTENLEIVYRVLIDEYYKKDLPKESLSVLSELVELRPGDEELKKEYRHLRKEAKLPGAEEKVEEAVPEEIVEEKPPVVEEEIKAGKELKAEEVRKEEEIRAEEKEMEEKGPEVEKGVEVQEEEKAVEAPPVAAQEGGEAALEGKVEEARVEKEEVAPPAADKAVPTQIEEEGEREEVRVDAYFEQIEGTDEMLEMNLTQADLYIEQGLIRNARRILENLRVHHPDDAKINERIAAVKKAVSTVSEEEILQRVEKVSKRETKLFRKKAQLERKEDLEEEKPASAGMFAKGEEGRGISGIEERRFYDLKERIVEEREAIKAVVNLQLKGDTATVEKELADIVSEFRTGVEKNVSKEDYESHFNLGIAFLEQGLVKEAIEEFKLVSKDKSRALECFALIASCHGRNGDFVETAKWLGKALELAEEGSYQSFALKYELAFCYEELKEMKKALALYNEIKDWNSEYRDVDKRIKRLAKTS
jgi:tetratricopeptide (TPR) repeat protein